MIFERCLDSNPESSRNIAIALPTEPPISTAVFFQIIFIIISFDFSFPWLFIMCFLSVHKYFSPSIEAVSVTSC